MQRYVVAPILTERGRDVNSQLLRDGLKIRLKIRLAFIRRCVDILLYQGPLTRLFRPTAPCRKTGTWGDMKSQLRGWAGWVIEFLKSSEGGVNCIFPRPFGVLQDVGFQGPL